VCCVYTSTTNTATLKPELNNNNNNNKLQKLVEAAELIDDKSPYYKYTLANVLENKNFKL